MVPAELRMIPSRSLLAPSLAACLPGPVALNKRLVPGSDTLTWLQELKAQSEAGGDAPAPALPKALPQALPKFSPAPAPRGDGDIEPQVLAVSNVLVGKCLVAAKLQELKMQELRECLPT